jgi:ATP-binding cassette subfamily C (CFTR/MRP) protein 10
VNHQAIDVSKVETLIPYLHQMWSAPSNILVSFILLYRILGPALIGGFAVMVLVLPVNLWLARIQSRLSNANMERKDKRIKLLNEVLSSIRVIKVFAWEGRFKDKVQGIRKDEMHTLLKAQMMRAVVMFFWFSTPMLVSVVTFTTFVLLGNELTADKVFESLALFNIMRAPLRIHISILNIAYSQKT